MPEVILKAIKLSKWFEIRRSIFLPPLYLKAVDKVNLDIYKGEILGLVGESGCGKTTLGKTILRLYKPTSGKIVFKGRDISRLEGKELKWYRRRTGYIAQNPFDALPPHFTIYKVLEEPLLIHKVGTKEERREMIFKALEDVKLTPVEDFAFKYPHMLSGGQLQRVVIARALILRPDLVIADEPVSMLDVSIRAEILLLLKSLKEKYGASFIYITHDLATARYFSDRIAIMYAGQIIELGDSNSILLKPLHPYTQALIAAIPEPDPENRKHFRNVPPGEPPSLINPPPGCRFAPRCPYATEKCRREEPPEVKMSGGRVVKCWLYA